jgi:hypothetical protein
MPLTQVSPGLLDSNAQYYGFKNRIINGAMVIDQRNNGSSVAISGAIYCPDRYQIRLAAGSGHTAQTQTSVVPTGFTNALRITVGTGASPGASDNGFIYQGVEGFNIADLGWGTASAQTVTLSFWVRSSVTGTYGFTITNGAGTRAYVTSYTVNSANTYEQKTITIPGDTSGTWDSTNGAGLLVVWDIGQGSTRSFAASTSWQANNAVGLSGGVKLVATTGATFYITGVQLEKGSTATSFDYRPYGTELQLCQRYFELVDLFPSSYGNTGCTDSNGSWRVPYYLAVTKRTTPTVSPATISGVSMVAGGAVPVRTLNATGSTPSSISLSTSVNLNAATVYGTIVVNVTAQISAEL